MDPQPTPGEAWLEIIKRPSLEAFSEAFAPYVALEASVLDQPILCPRDLRAFFDATREMYDTIAFTNETMLGGRTYLEWEGRFQGRYVAGETLLIHDSAGLIESIRIYHRPYDQVLAFSAELRRRLSADPSTASILEGACRVVR